MTDDPGYEIGDPRLRRFMEQHAAQGFTDEDGYRFDAITQGLAGARFPLTRQDALARLAANGASENVVVDVRGLPDGARFDTAHDLLLALGIGTAGRIDVPGAPDRDPEGGAPALADD